MFALFPPVMGRHRGLPLRIAGSLFRQPEPHNGPKGLLNGSQEPLNGSLDRFNVSRDTFSLSPDTLTVSSPYVPRILRCVFRSATEIAHLVGAKNFSPLRIPPFAYHAVAGRQSALQAITYHIVQKIAVKKLRLIIFYTAALNFGAAAAVARRCEAAAGFSPGHYPVFSGERGRDRRIEGHLRGHHEP